MGLGLSLRVPSSALEGRSWKDLREGIVAFAEREPADPLLRRFFRGNAGEDWVRIGLYPAEEDVGFFFSEAGDLVCSAKTSTAGPGYHAFLVHWLEALAGELRVRWERHSEEREGDDTDYWSHRDLARLQSESAAWLKGLAEYLLGKEGEAARGFVLGLPESFPLEREGWYAASALGFWKREWFQSVAEASEDELLALGSQFFPWWDEGLEGAFWARLGTVLCWLEVPWHVPTDGERGLYQTVHECFARAADLGASAGVPQEEWAELERLLEASSGANDPQPGGRPAPSADRIGFHRRAMRSRLPGGWSLSLPGYFYSDVENGGEVQAFRFRERNVRASTFTVNGKDDAPVPAQDLAGKGPEGAIRHEASGVQGWAVIKQETDEKGSLYWTLHGESAAPGNLCIVTICYEDEGTRDWALATWKSLAHSRPEVAS
jgi:hypothetical protein